MTLLIPEFPSEAGQDTEARCAACGSPSALRLVDGRFVCAGPCWPAASDDDSER